MAREGYLILDSDLQMMEPDDLWVRFLDEPYRANPPRFFGEQQQRLVESSADKSNADTIEGMEVQGLAIPAHGKSPGAAASRRELRRRSRAGHPHFAVARARGFDAPSTLTAMDIEGIDVAVMYGTRGRQILCHDDLPPGYAAALARAYNNWAADYCRTDPRRLKFAAQVAMHDVTTAVEEARRCVSELGAVAVIGTPNPVNGQHLHDEVCEPLWNMLEQLDAPIGFHPTGTTALRDDAGRRYVGHANFHPIAHAIRNPFELMGAIASMTTGGVLERHPKLRCAFLEGTAGWLYWWLWRLDDQWEKFGPGCEHQLTMPPSDYFKRQCYIALDVDEEPAVDAVNKMGAEYFVVSSDYPHSDAPSRTR
jgi:predicted TIM-barrel fold metal-dependent hydrolase